MRAGTGYGGKMIEMEIRLTRVREPKKLGDFLPDQVIYDRTVGLSFSGPEDIDFIKSILTNAFNEFKNLLPGILKGLK
jgi:hypothetical protein